jgi:hypothetical protein
MSANFEVREMPENHHPHHWVQGNLISGNFIGGNARVIMGDIGGTTKSTGQSIPPLETHRLLLYTKTVMQIVMRSSKVCLHMLFK